MTVREVLGADGTPIVYRAFGDPSSRPLVLLHGWAQSSGCWGDPLLEDLAGRYRVIAVDLRGHGYSGAPADGYDDRAVWASDVRAVLAAENCTGAVLLGWSYGGLVICDYLAVHGTADIAGVVLVGAITSIGRGEKGGKVGAAMRAAVPGAMSEDPQIALAALDAFGASLVGAGRSAATGPIAQALLGNSLRTPPRVRSALFARAVGNDDLLRGLDLPVLVLHGTADSVVDLSAAEHAASLLPRATTSYWDGAEHGLFVEDPRRFAEDVVRFVDTLE
ncbi:alpha/beta fold hydrolase [Rhodococcus zopfii]|uniref:Alpha/beta hydrolase n=1 Tax=Rhodococcus zopfii TaxID=43772 RepID=A0ABU3WKM5_9NOCA|nr:alpha/beta hydrolase [Rhodococcus zopfii]MDV2474549.1 alpha/beta hydrolase [Rhodococcus zopfii]